MGNKILDVTQEFPPRATHISVETLENSKRDYHAHPRPRWNKTWSDETGKRRHMR